jgi:hypothetical protein
VDILTHYGVKKQAAKVAKTVKYGSSVDGISTVDPDQYAARCRGYKTGFFGKINKRGKPL